MATDFVRRDEFAEAMQAMLAELRTMRLAIMGLDTKITAMDSRMSNIETVAVGINATVTGLESRVSGIESHLEVQDKFLTQFKASVEASHRDLSKQMADGFAVLQEQVNDMKREK